MNLTHSCPTYLARTGPDVWPGRSRPFADYDLAPTGVAVPHGVALSGDGALVFVVTGRGADEGLQLTVFKNVAPDPASDDGPADPSASRPRG